MCSSKMRKKEVTPIYNNPMRPAVLRALSASQQTLHGQMLSKPRSSELPMVSGAASSTI